MKIMTSYWLWPGGYGSSLICHNRRQLSLVLSTSSGTKLYCIYHKHEEPVCITMMIYRCNAVAFASSEHSHRLLRAMKFYLIPKQPFNGNLENLRVFVQLLVSRRVNKISVDWQLFSKNMSTRVHFWII